MLCNQLVSTMTHSESLSPSVDKALTVKDAMTVPSLQCCKAHLVCVKHYLRMLFHNQSGVASAYPAKLVSTAQWLCPDLDLCPHRRRLLVDSCCWPPESLGLPLGRFKPDSATICIARAAQSFSNQTYCPSSDLCPVQACQYWGC